MVVMAPSNDALMGLKFTATSIMFVNCVLLSPGRFQCQNKIEDISNYESIHGSRICLVLSALHHHMASAICLNVFFRYFPCEPSYQLFPECKK